MSTLRDYVLDCRCPNCGTLMTQKPAAPKPHWSLVACDYFAFVLLAIGLVLSITGNWGPATFDLALGVFLKTGWRAS